MRIRAQGSLWYAFLFGVGDMILIAVSRRSSSLHRHWGAPVCARAGRHRARGAAHPPSMVSLRAGDRGCWPSWLLSALFFSSGWCDARATRRPSPSPGPSPGRVDGGARYPAVVVATAILGHQSRAVLVSSRLSAIPSTRPSFLIFSSHTSKTQTNIYRTRHAGTFVRPNN
jgi:hypothetical protein